MYHYYILKNKDKVVGKETSERFIPAPWVEVSPEEYKRLTGDAPMPNGMNLETLSPDKKLRADVDYIAALQGVTL